MGGIQRPELRLSIENAGSNRDVDFPAVRATQFAIEPGA
jgi:hypothetical protein